MDAKLYTSTTLTLNAMTQSSGLPKISTPLILLNYEAAIFTA